MRKYVAWSCAIVSIIVLWLVARGSFEGDDAPDPLAEGISSKPTEEQIEKPAAPRRARPQWSTTKVKDFVQLIEKAEAAASGKPSDEEIAAFAKSLEEAVTKENVEAVGDQFDWEQLIRLTEPKDQASISKEKILAFRNGPGNLPRMFITPVSRGGVFRYLRIINAEKDRRPLFRVANSTGDFNYYALHVHKRSGSVVAYDADNYTTGERITATFRRSNSGFGARRPAFDFSKQPPAQLQNDCELVIRVALSDGSDLSKVDEALAAYDRLQESMRKDKLIMFCLVRLSMVKSGPQAEAAINAFRMTYPNDPSLPILRISYYLSRKDFDRAIQAVDELDRVIQGDSFLHVMRSRIYRTAGRFKLAREAAETARTAEPKLLAAYIELLCGSLNERNFAETAKLLTSLQDNVEISVSTLVKDEMFEEFVKSPEYAAWNKSPQQE